MLVEHPLIGGLTFTGSTGVGRRLAATAAAAGVPIQAEMGGKNASIVLADADLDLATEQVLFGAFRSTGQKCTATSRLVVDERVADELIDRLRARLANWIVGDPTDPDVHMGPVISQTAAAGIRSGITKAIEQGATLLNDGDNSGGEDPSTACFVPPALLQLPAIPRCVANTAWRDEIFGPVLTVRRAANTQEAFALANESEFGLSASVFTQDITQVLDAVDEIDVGILHVNSESAGADPHVPFGGAKKVRLRPQRTRRRGEGVLHPHHHGLPTRRRHRITGSEQTATHLSTVPGSPCVDWADRRKGNDAHDDHHIHGRAGPVRPIGSPGPPQNPPVTAGAC